MWQPTVDVLDSGAVVLGENVVCDGYAPGREFRVQTHIHDDHMGEFDRSKGCQDIVLSPETLSLLIAEYNADLAYRENLLPVCRGVIKELQDGSSVQLLASNHILGSCQVAVQRVDGKRVGYSGDFGWPLDEVIEVDELVVDSTYGSPRSVRRYTQEEAEARLVELVVQRLRYGCVHIRAHRGTVERVLQLLGDDVGVPVLASERLIQEALVYQEHGFAVGTLVSLQSDEGTHALAQRSFVRLYSKGDGFRNEVTDGGTTIVCSAFMVDVDDPLKVFSDRAYSVALSNHADFYETLEYVKATKAKVIVTDNTRNHGQELAMAINQSLIGVRAVPSTNLQSMA
ncbi:MAG: hypothetical protein OXJ53_08710 [Gammaproteobacteria bacterium]|nr:hypothetical protein [Gammaproteobacteria bacterium]